VVRWKVYRGLGDPRVAGGEETAAGCSASSRGKAGAALGVAVAVAWRVGAQEAAGAN
jgi:hypothetical protein